MAISDAYVNIFCDGEGCREKCELGLEYKYMNWSANSGYYDSDKESINQKLVNETDWIVDDDKQYCSEQCKERYKK